MQNELERAKLASVYGMCENIDDNVGRIVGLLDSLKLAENTIVIYLSDNGPNGTRYNGGMRGTKGSVHEGGVRVPSLVRWLGHIAPGSVREAVVAHIDLLPTLATLCQIPLPDSLLIDGVNLADWWLGKQRELPERTLFVQQSDQELTPERGAVRTADYRYVLYPDYSGLYHLPTDPGETHDLTAERPALADSLRTMYFRLVCGNASGQRGLYARPDWFSRTNADHATRPRKSVLGRNPLPGRPRLGPRLVGELDPTAG